MFVVSNWLSLRSIFVTVFTYLISRVYLLNSSDLSHRAFVGHYDIRATAVIHQRYTVGKRGKRRGAIA